MKGRSPRPLQLFRYSVQSIVAVYVLAIVVGNTTGGRWAANLHTICPFGGVVNIYTYLAGGGYIDKLHSAVFVMLLALVVGLVLTGKSFCGWICPLGSIQQGLGWIGERLWPRAYNKVPQWLERILHYLKWVVLVWVLVQTARSGRLIFQDWDPYYNLYHIWTDEIAMSGYVVTALTLLASLFIPRPFSRYACPLGAFNGIFNSFSFIGIKREVNTCTECGLCTKACPVNIDLCAGTTIRSIECTRCLRCVEACPQNSGAGDTLKLHTWFSGRAGRRSVSTWLFAGIAIAAFVLPILITNLTGDFQTTGGRGGGGGGGDGHESTQPGASQQVRGSTTLADIQAMGADVEEFLREFGIPADTPLDTKLGRLVEEYSLTMSEARAYLDTVR